jgi:potassium/hydrogen antiporter
MDRVEVFLFSTALLLVLCVIASKATGRLGMPTLVVFLGVGILAGSEGIGGIYFDNANYAKTLGIVSLVYILFSGGLDTKWSSIRPVIKSGISLATLGVLITCFSVGLFTHYLLDFTMLEGLLLGAIISSTDAGAVFTILRSRSIHLKGNLKPTLELESGSNDPMAVFLVTTILLFMKQPDYSLPTLIPRLIQQMLLGFGVGFLGGKGMAWGFNRLKLEFEGLYTVLSLAFILIVYTSAQVLDGNGFLAVYVAGVVLGNESFVFKKTLMLLHDGVSWLMQSSMFLTLGLLIYPSHVIHVSGPGILIAGFMILVARPLSVFISLSNAKISWREKTLISWVGLRGAVPVVMATYPLVAGIGRAEYIFNLVFFVSVTSLLIQGTSIPFVAKLLGLYIPEPKKLENPLEHTAHASLSNNMSYIFVPAHSASINKSIVDMKLPQDLLIVAIERKGEVIIPRGATQIEAHDKLMVLAQKEPLNQFRDKLNQAPEPIA